MRRKDISRSSRSCEEGGYKQEMGAGHVTTPMSCALLRLRVLTTNTILFSAKSLITCSERLVKQQYPMETASSSNIPWKPRQAAISHGNRVKQQYPMETTLCKKISKAGRLAELEAQDMHECVIKAAFFLFMTSMAFLAHLLRYSSPTWRFLCKKQFPCCLLQ